jgi:hypothetical protein
MTDEDGQEVDVDLFGGVEMFDAWRIKWFLDEATEDEPSIAQLQEACAYLAGLGELTQVARDHEGDRWYALPGPR